MRQWAPRSFAVKAICQSVESPDGSLPLTPTYSFPGGIASVSPGLRRASLGKHGEGKLNPDGVASSSTSVIQRRWGGMLLRCRSYGALRWCIGFLQVCRPSRDWERPKPRSPVSMLRATPS